MTEKITLDIETLRAYVRGQLSDEDSTKVIVSLGGCMYPIIPTTLMNLQDEWNNEREDEKLPPHMKPLSDLFVELQGDCYAFIDGLIPIEQENHPPEPVETIRLEEQAELRVVGVTSRVKPDVRCMAVHTTDDLGRVCLLYHQKLEPGTGPRPVLVKDEYFVSPDVGRVTFWLSASTDVNALHHPPAEGIENLYSWLSGLRDSQDCYIFAHRLTPAAFAERECEIYERQESEIQRELEGYLSRRLCETGYATDADFHEARCLLEQRVQRSCPESLKTKLLSELDDYLAYVQDVAIKKVLDNPEALKKMVKTKRIPYDLVK